MATPGDTADRSAVVDAVERLAYSLVALTSSAMASDAPSLEPTFRQWRLLVVLGAFPGGCRLGAVAGRIGGSVPSASRLVRRLEARGLVTITRDPADRRGIRVALSPDGRTLRSAVLEARRALIADSLRDVPLTSGFAAQLGELASALEVMVTPAVVDTPRGRP